MDRNADDWLNAGSLSVALRKESVDRNSGVPYSAAIRLASLSARRAWIEITQRRDFKRLSLVALRKESVDRNFVTAFDVLAVSGRSPQGERG